jgi:ATP-binding cassette subfamily C protein
MAFQSLRDLAAGAVAHAGLSAVFLFPAFVLMLLYDTALGLVSLATGLVALALIVLGGWVQVGRHRQRFAAARRLAGDLFQFINGMGKLRSSAAEASAFAHWARLYREQKQAEMQIGRTDEHLAAFSAAMPMLASAVLLGAALWRGGISVGDFMVVYTALMMFCAALVALGSSFESIAALVPGYEQVQPILEARPESPSTGSLELQLDGEFRLDHVSFRYTEQGPMTLDDVSLKAEPGEFVAIVGESGAGKSTLLQLALGLEEPTTGAVFYDDRDLTHLNRDAVRRQVGVVLQDNDLRPGTVLDNIIGMAGDLTVDDAWRAAQLASVDRDIAAMPMQMFTIVGGQTGNFSGGEIQRIRIAAALARNPRIVFLDEATNALDAVNQASVMQSIEQLAATRIVIAHRLSTIRNADRIHVLQAGRVVQSGTFEALMQEPGVFMDLMKRQMH